jgi:DNA-binding transcriptional ArsR family regulator
VLTIAALADPTRRRIVEMLAERDRTAGEIVAEFDITPPAISQHLKILRTAKLVTVRPEGQRRIHSLNPSGLDEIEAWITKTKQFWTQRLDTLESLLRAEDERESKSK